jgi:hypothetical protein
VPDVNTFRNEGLAMTRLLTLCAALAFIATSANNASALNQNKNNPDFGYDKQGKHHKQLHNKKNKSKSNENKKKNNKKSGEQ